MQLPTGKVRLFNGLTLCCYLIGSLLISHSVSANEFKISDSIGLAFTQERDILRAAFIQQDKTVSMTQQLLSHGTTSTRVDGDPVNQIANAPSAQTAAHHYRIYDAHTKLIGDKDNDGYYQKFSVTFDADSSSSGWQVVYAKLYLSNDNGENWIHYYTTDDFIIESDHSYDDYEVVTTLHNGYPADQYDVLIDLYEDGHDHDIVATYSNEDSYELAALPLESKNHDSRDHTPDSKSDGKGGAWSLFSLFLLALFSVTRRPVN